MQRTLITEQPDGTFQCTVTLTADELPEFLRTVPREGSIATGSDPTQSEKNALALCAEAAPVASEGKPPAQRAAAQGFNVGAVVSGEPELPPVVTTLLAHNRFLVFAESKMGPVPAELEVREFVTRRIVEAGPSAWEPLVQAYQRWHLETFPGQSPFPG